MSCQMLSAVDSHVAERTLCFYGFDAAHLDAGGAVGFVRADAVADFFFGGGFLKGAEFFVHVVASLLFVEECFDSADQTLQEWHGGSFSLRIRLRGCW